MTWTRRLGTGLALTAAIALVSAQTSQTPAFDVDPFWPKPLPDQTIGRMNAVSPAASRLPPSLTECPLSDAAPPHSADGRKMAPPIDGALEEGALGRGAVKKVLIVVAVEYKGGEIGRIRLRRVPDGSADSLQRSSTTSPSPAAWCAPMGGSATIG